MKLAKDADEAADLTKKMIGMTLVTHQTGPEGRVVRKVLIEEALNIDKELYLGITLDRRIGMPVVMASKQGGMEIEEVAERDPNAIHREPIDARPRRAAVPGARRRERARTRPATRTRSASTSCRS